MFVKLKLVPGSVLYLAVVVTVFLLVAGSRIHMSSIGALTEEGVAPPGMLAGTARAIRSDEYLRSAPAQIGSRRFAERTGSSPDAVMTTPLDDGYPLGDLGVVSNPRPAGDRTIGWFINKFLNLDTSLSRKLPIAVDFSATWWRGTLYMFLGVGLLFGALGISWPYSLAASLMIWFSPANQWWSLWPLESLGTGLLSAGLLLTAVSRVSRDEPRSTRARLIGDAVINVMLISASGVLAMRLPATYQPWSVAVTLVLASITGGFLLNGTTNFRKLRWYVATGGVLGVLALFVVVRRVMHSMGTMLTTVYPGERRFTGLVGYPKWGATLNWELQRSASAAVNQSELAIGHVILLIPVVVVLVAGWRQRSHPLFRPLCAGTIAISIFYMWTMVTWPRWLAQATFMDRIPPDRTLQIVGVIIPLIYVVATVFARNGGVPYESARSVSLITGAAVLILTLQDGSSVRSILSWVSVGSLWWTATLTAFLIAWPLRQKRHGFPLVAVVVAVVASGIGVNPLMKGLGILGHSGGQKILAAAISQDDRRWAADNVYLDAPATAAGMRLLSGNQGSGPNVSAYQLLDPPSLDINKWNRAGSYVTFSWTHGPDVVFLNPAKDVVQIQIDPCNPVLDRFDLAWVASSGDQPGYRCLVPYGTFSFNEMTVRLYHRVNVPG